MHETHPSLQTKRMVHQLLCYLSYHLTEIREVEKCLYPWQHLQMINITEVNQVCMTQETEQGS